MQPPASGFFQEITNVIIRINDGIKWIQKPASFCVNEASPENASSAKSDKNRINIIVSTLGTQNNF